MEHLIKSLRKAGITEDYVLRILRALGEERDREQRKTKAKLLSKINPDDNYNGKALIKIIKEI